MSILNLFRKPKPKATFGGHSATITDEVKGSPQRLKARLQRLEKSITRADGERKKTMQKEINGIRSYLEAVRQALE